MVGKLLKHEFRATGRSMLLVYLALAATAVLANLSIRLMNVTDNAFLNILFGLIIAAFVIGMVAAAVVMMIDRFYRSLLKSQGYLMHTLPVTVHGHIWSKLIVSLVWFAATFVLVWLLIVSTALIQSGTDLGAMLKDLPTWREFCEAFRSSGASVGGVALLMLEVLGGMILACLTLCLHFYAAMALGHMFSKNQILLSIVFFIAISILFNIAGTGLGVLVIRNENIFLAPTFAETVTLMNGFLGQMLLVQLIQGAVLYAAAFLPLRYRLNLA